MNILSIAITLLLAAMLGLLAIGLPWAILRNMAKGHERRRLLAEGIDALRLGRMVDGLGNDRENYLHRERVVDIEHQMRRCDDCDATERCDEVLQQERPVQAAQVDFCPNRDALTPTARD